METTYKSETVDKNNSTLMELVAWSLCTMGVMDRESFMDNYCTTLGNIIYINFEVGNEKHKDLWNQIVICVHEHQHVYQAREDTTLLFSAQYLVSKAYRALQEAEAYRTCMELHQWRYGNIPKTEPKRLAEKVRRYACSSEDVQTVEKILDISVQVIERGGIISPVAATAIEWLEKNVPDLRS